MGDAATVIEAHHRLQGAERAVVHVGSGERHVAQRGSLEPPQVGGIEGHLMASQVTLRRQADGFDRRARKRHRDARRDLDRHFAAIGRLDPLVEVAEAGVVE